MDEIKKWHRRISSIYNSLPPKMHTYKWWSVFRSVSEDVVLLIDIIDNKELALGVSRALDSLEQCPEVGISTIVDALNAYYAERRDTGRWEQVAFGFLDNKPVPPTFILSYGRWEHNAILKRLEFWNDDSVFQNTLVFVQPDQEEKYRSNHPSFNYWPQAVGSVGERLMAVLDFCKKHGIPRAIVLEDDVQEFRHIKKGGVDSGSHLSSNEEDLGGAYLKYIAAKGDEIMNRYKDVVLVGIRNRVMANNESTSIIGVHEPMRGGCPNMAYYIDVDRFAPIYKTIPSEHYSPQYDWAIQCAIVRAHKRWAMITGIVKDEFVGGRSVIGYTGDREALAQQYIDYYGVSEVMSYRRFKDTELQGVKIFYDSRRGNKNEKYETLY